jgi:hypothetical protein
MGDAGAKYYSFCASYAVQNLYATVLQELDMAIYTRNTNFKPVVMLTQLFIQSLSGSVFSGVKQLERGANHLPSCSADRGTTTLYQSNLLFSRLHIYAQS